MQGRFPRHPPQIAENLNWGRFTEILGVGVGDGLPLPTGADAYILSDILHDWDDDQARQILTGCRRAAAPNGTVVVIEPGHETAGTAMDLFMLMCFGGQERTLDDLVRLAEDSGLVLRDSGPVAAGRTALEFTPQD